MINLHEFQNSFLLKWACNLINDKEESWKAIPIFFFRNVGGLSIFESNIPFNKAIGMDEIKSRFWKKVLRIWLENKETDNDITTSDTINNNCMITVNKNPLFVKNALSHNIIYIKDMLTDNGEIITFNDYNQKIGANASNVIDYLTIKTGINKIKHRLIIAPSKAIQFKKHSLETIKRKKIYQLLHVDEKCHCEIVW